MSDASDVNLIGLNHFWSDDGVECLWCYRIRTPEEIAAWIADGKPAEECKK